MALDRDSILISILKAFTVSGIVSHFLRYELGSVSYTMEFYIKRHSN